MKSSLEIAQEAVLRPIMDVATEMGLEEDEVDLYGKYKAKIDLSVIDRLSGGVETASVSREQGEVVLDRRREVGRSHAPLDATVHFVGTVPIAWDVALLEPYRKDFLGIARVTALTVGLRAHPANGHAIPDAEAMTFDLDLAGIHIRGAQTLVYTSFLPCGG